MSATGPNRRAPWILAIGAVVLVVLVLVGLGCVAVSRVGDAVDDALEGDGESDDGGTGCADQGGVFGRDGLFDTSCQACADSEVPLMRDAASGDISAVRRALAEGADPDTTDEAGNSALACAGPKGMVATVELLLAAGADPNTVARDGDTVVGDAVRYCETRVLELLLAAGADPDDSGTDESPLDQALQLGEPAEVEVLLAAGATPEVSDVISLRGRDDDSSCAPDTTTRVEGLTLVLAAGGDPDDVLEQAVTWSAWDAVPPALLAGADPDADVGFAGLPVCIDSEAVVLADCGPIDGAGHLDGQDVGLRDAVEDERPTTALAHAAWRGETEAVRALLAAGADPDVVGPLGVTALAAAAGAGQEEVVDLLLPVVTLPVGPEVVLPSKVAAEAGHTALADRLRAAGA